MKEKCMKEIKKGKRRERKKWRKNNFIIIFFHYFEQNDQYRIERPSVITGGLKITKAIFSSNRDY